MTPNAAYQQLVRGQIEHVALDELADRVLATSVVPYPPGIPMLMPGETTGAADGPYLSYLRALAAWDRRFPGFGHDTHGVENRDGTYYVQCLKKGAAEGHADIFDGGEPCVTLASTPRSASSGRSWSAGPASPTSA